MKIGELFVALGFKVDDSDLKAFDKGVKDLKKSLLVIPAIATAAAFAIDRFTASSINGAVALQNFNNQTGLFSDRLQELQLAGQLSDLSLSAEQVTQQVQALQMNLKQIELGGGNVRPFAFLGISPLGKNAFQIIDELREAIKGVDPSRVSTFLQEMGLSPNFINLLKLSREEFEALGSEFRQSKETSKSLLDLGTALTRLKIQLKFVKDLAIAGLAPALKQLFSLVSNLARATTAFSDTFKDLLENSKAFKNVIVFGLIPAFALLFTAMFPLTALMTAILLLVEDVFVFFQGGKSATGLLLDKMNEIGKPFQSIFEQFFQDVRTAGKLIDALIINPLQDTANFFGQLFTFGAGQTPEANFTRVPQFTPANFNTNGGGGSNVNNYFTINTNASSDRIVAGMERFMQNTNNLVNAELGAGAAF